jgi:hypothetical protein
MAFGESNAGFVNVLKTPSFQPLSRLPEFIGVDAVPVF